MGAYGALTAPAAGAFSITPNDSTVIWAASLYIGTGGDIAVTTEEGDSVTFTAVPDGAILPVRVTQVKSTSTTASNIVGLR